MQTENFTELHNQINELLKAKYPEQADRDKIISDMGELIISETFVELLESVQDEMVRQDLVNALNAGDQEKVISITESLSIDLYSMLENKSKEILKEAME